jgi:GT2 family glycosyltransferase
MAREFGATVIRLTSNEGFPAGVNAGVAASHGDVIALLNDDAFAGARWLECSVDVLTDHSIAAVQPKLVYASKFAEVVLDDDAHFAPGDARPLGRMIRSLTADGDDQFATARGPGLHQPERDDHGPFRWTAGREPFFVPIAHPSSPLVVDGEAVPARRVVDVINSAGSYLQSDGYAGNIGDGEPDDGQYDAPVDRFSLCGASLAFRRETWNRIGAFASEFFSYYEDTDWCWRAQLAGLRLRYDPTTTVRHVGGASTGGFMDDRTRLLYQRNRILCLIRNAPFRIATRETWNGIAHEARFKAPGLRRALMATIANQIRARRSAPGVRDKSRQRIWQRYALPDG